MPNKNERNRFPDLAGKKLLILGGNAAHTKFVNAARELGVHTIVTDYLPPESSPAKRAADEYWMVSYGDIDTLAQRCREERIDGVLAVSHESAQIPYYQLCTELKMPCYGELEQFEILSNKRLFKELCCRSGVSVIPEYALEMAMAGKADFPVIVKPVDRCGSNGMTVCRNAEELEAAVKAARDESLSGEMIIEEYLANKNSFQITYFFADGTPYLIRTVDGYKGLPEDQLDRVALCSVSPSVYTDAYLQTTHERFVDMLRSIGVRNGPVMAQGFYDDGVFRFYDPGRRFPGTDFEIVYRDLFGIDLMQIMVVFALTGKMPEMPAGLVDENVYLRGSKAVVLFPTLRPGTIGSVSGHSELRNDPRVWNVNQKHVAGETIKQVNTVSQRIFEVDFVVDSDREVRDTIRKIQESISVTDDEGKPMIAHPFDVERLQ